MTTRTDDDTDFNVLILKRIHKALYGQKYAYRAHIYKKTFNNSNRDSYVLHLHNHDTEDVGIVINNDRIYVEATYGFGYYQSIVIADINDKKFFTRNYWRSKIKLVRELLKEQADFQEPLVDED